MSRNGSGARRLRVSFALINRLCGCGLRREPPGNVEGPRPCRVSDGEPVRYGTVELESLKHPFNARARIDDDGHFELSTFETGDGAVAGRHRAIVVQLMVLDDPTIKHQKDHGDSVAQRYSMYSESGLFVDVETNDDNEIELRVARRARRRR